MRTRLAPTVATLLLFELVAAPTASALSFSTYDSGNNGELITSSPGDSTFRVLYSVDVGPLATGDILVVKGDPELTNNGSLSGRVDSHLILTTSASAVTGTELDEVNGYYVVPGDRGVPYKHAIYQVSSSTKHFVSFLVATTRTMAVEADCGRLQVLVIHP